MIILDPNGKPYKRTVVFDVETTGLSPESGDRIMEIGAVALERKTIVDEFYSLINTYQPIYPAAQKIHGITKEMLAGQPQSEKVIPKFSAFIESSILVAHYADFDLSFVGSEFKRLGIDFRQPYYCTLALGKKMFPELERHNLESLYMHLYKTKPKAMHRALDDAQTTAKIWTKINFITNKQLFTYLL